MFKKSERVTAAEFTNYFSSGKRTHTKHLTCITAPATTKKIGVVVGKKVSKLAVKRNLLRRRIYAQLRKELPVTYTGVCILLVKPSFITLPRKTAEQCDSEVIATLSKTT